MKNKKIKIILIIALCFVVFRLHFSPENRTQRFVHRNHALLEERIDNNQPIPVNIDFLYDNDWSRDHKIYEFTIGTKGLVPSSSYYGCYYSPDDVPVAFQNMDVELTCDEDGVWHWQGDGDNHGFTYKIRDKWYYFQAHF